MARPEAGLWDFLRERMPVGGHYSRIESETSPGFPDLHYTLEGVTGGMEFKCNPGFIGKLPFKGERGLRKSQYRWIREELDVGGKVILVLQMHDNICFLEGHYFDSLHEMGPSDIMRTASVIWERGGSCDVPALARFMTDRP